MVLVEMDALGQNLRDLRKDGIYNSFIAYKNILE